MCCLRLAGRLRHLGDLAAHGVADRLDEVRPKARAAIGQSGLGAGQRNGPYLGMALHDGELFVDTHFFGNPKSKIPDRNNHHQSLN